MTLYEEALMMLDEALSRVRMSYDGQGDDVLEELIEEAVKRLEAEFAALIADVAEAEKLLIRQTVDAVNERESVEILNAGRIGFYDHAAVEEAQQAADEAYQAATHTAHRGLAADIQKIMEPRA